MTPQHVRRAALTLRRLAVQQAARDADLRRQQQAERHARHLRTQRQQRDAQGRWVAGHRTRKVADGRL